MTGGGTGGEALVFKVEIGVGTDPYIGPPAESKRRERAKGRYASLH